MTAIAGAAFTDGREAKPSDLAGVMDLLAPMGRDGGGTWAGAVGRTSVVLGAALRRRWPEDDADEQPASGPGVVDRDGDAAGLSDGLVLVGDLGLTNRDALAADLGLTGADAAAMADSAFVLAAYRRWGKACASRLRGEFAFALADPAAGGVYLARDHLGLRPLSVHAGDGVVAFSTLSYALTRFAGVGHRLDRRRVSEWLAFVTASDRTFVEGVVPFPASHHGWVDAGGLHLERYWRLQPGRWSARDTPEAHADAMRDALDRAVRSMRSRGRVGVMLSGGLDSTAVAAALALQQSPTVVRTYTSVPRRRWVGPSGLRDADESPLVRDLAAAHPNLRPTFLEPRDEPILDRYDVLFAMGSPPPRNPCNQLWIDSIMEEAAADGVTTLFTGARGNIGFSADGESWLVDLARRGRFRRVVSEARAEAAALGAPTHWVLRRHLVKEAAPPWLVRIRRRKRGLPDPVTDLLVGSALRPELWDEADVAGHFPSHDESSRLDRDRARAEKVGAGPLMVAEARAVGEAHFGVSMVDPTADIELLELAATQPSWVRHHRGLDRAVARLAVAGRVPDSIRLRRRRGAQLPDHFDVLTRARAEVADEVARLTDHATSREVMDTDRLRTLVAEWPVAPAPDAPRVEQRHLHQAYRSALLRAVLMGRYLRWFETRTGPDVRR